VFRIFGPPGTGKTTKMLDMVDRALGDGVPSNKIAFLAFTRKAASEARERAARRFSLDPKEDLPHFRTLHSFAYRSLGLNERNLMRAENFKDLSNKIGIPLTTSKTSDFEDSNTQTADHPILNLINLARLKKTDLRREYNQSGLHNIQWMEVDFVDRCYSEYKQVHALLDYTDMLVLFVKEADRICPSFDISFLDEAQDLSLLQWDIANAIDKKSKRMYCAGDDDQAIFRWNGADVDYFISLPGGSEVLEQSYRIPSSVHTLAESIVNRIGRRFPKTYRPRQEVGSISRISEIRELDMATGSWLIMAQANYMLSPLATELKNLGYLFERNGQRSISERLSLAVNGWEALRKGRAIDKKTAEKMYSLMSGNNKHVARGKKKIQGERTDTYTLEELREHHGLLIDKDLAWFDALDLIPDQDIVYVKALLRKGEKFNAHPRIKLSTIHGTKGGEADNVVLFTDLTAAALQTQADDLHRVFYVGVTRTRERLFIVDPEDYQRAYPL